MASGKSSVGAELARLLGREFLDLDAEIERQTGQSIAELFRQSGESAFRSAEANALSHLLENGPRSVVALGGGTWIQPANRELILQTNSLVIFLDAPSEELWARIDKDGAGSRPLVHDEASFRKLYQERRPHYLRAHRRVETAGKLPVQVAREILELLELEDS